MTNVSATTASSVWEPGTQIAYANTTMTTCTVAEHDKNMDWKVLGHLTTQNKICSDISGNLCYNTK